MLLLFLFLSSLHPVIKQQLYPSTFLLTSSLCVSLRTDALYSFSYTSKYGHVSFSHTRDTNFICSSEFTITCAREHRKVGERGWYKPKWPPQHPSPFPQMDRKNEKAIKSNINQFWLVSGEIKFDMKMPLSGASLLTETGCTWNLSFASSLSYWFADATIFELSHLNLSFIKPARDFHRLRGL